MVSDFCGSLGREAKDAKMIQNDTGYYTYSVLCFDFFIFVLIKIAYSVF